MKIGEDIAVTPNTWKGDVTGSISSTLKFWNSVITDCNNNSNSSIVQNDDCAHS